MEQRAIPTRTSTTATAPGSRDGIGAGDHDQPYRFGSRPSVAWTYPFTPIQYARLMVLRGRIGDGEFADDVRRSS